VTSTALIAEPSQTFRVSLEAMLEAAGLLVIGRSSLDDARRDVSERTPSLVVTNLKLGSFNGVHLVYLARLANPLAVCVVYGEPDRADEVQRAGAIYVEQSGIKAALADILPTLQLRAPQRTPAVIKFPTPNVDPAVEKIT
jgi:DNA-binding NtrC family response regulator